MVNAKIESMQLEKEGLLAQIRHLEGEAYDLKMQIREKEDELTRSLKFEERRIHKQSGRGLSFPANMDKEYVGPIKEELNDLKERRSIISDRLAKTKEAFGSLGALLDQCRRHAGQAEPTRWMPQILS